MGHRVLTTRVVRLQSMLILPKRLNHLVKFPEYESDNMRIIATSRNAQYYESISCDNFVFSCYLHGVGLLRATSAKMATRGTRVKQTDRQLDVPASGNLHERTFKGEVQPRYNPFEANRNYEPRNWRFEQSNEPFPKYIGGFHSSYYSNLGVPNGDIGFRGNGIYWPPW